MLKKISLLAFTAIVMISCGQVNQQTSEVSDVKLISELVAEPLGFDGQQVQFEGVITHICKHSGDKMRVNQVDDADFSIMVMLEEFQTQFSPAFEGKQVRVTGILKTIVRNMDALAENHDHDHAHDGEEGHACSSTEEAVKRMQERGITPDIRTIVELKGFEIMEPTQQQESTDTEISPEIAEAV